MFYDEKRHTNVIGFNFENDKFIYDATLYKNNNGMTIRIYNTMTEKKIQTVKIMGKIEDITHALTIFYKYINPSTPLIKQ